MNNLEVISVNFWQIVISLLNLTIMFLIIKKLLFKPVKKIISERQAYIDGQYQNAQEAEKSAAENKIMWENKLNGAKEQANAIIKLASENADRRGNEIVAEAKEKAQGILSRAQMEAELEKKKAADEMKKEIADVSTRISEKILQREIQTDDHRKLIESLIKEIGENNDGNK